MQFISVKLLLVILGVVLGISAFLVSREQMQKAEEVDSLQRYNQSVQATHDATKRTNDAQPQKYEAPKLP